jgi:hypothetical protein
MIRRRLAAVIAGICLNTTPLFAQTSELTITVAEATVHRGPSTGSPVIGRVSRGTRLEVTRDIGSWVKVSWPSEADGAGYVHEGMGSLAAPTGATAPVPIAASSRARVSESSSLTGGLQPQATSPRTPRTSASSYVVVPRHAFGLGARLGSAPSLGLGASARAWTRGPLGVQVHLSRYQITSLADSSVMTSTQFGPSLLMTLGRHVTDHLWVRPYVGGGVSLHRSTLSSPVLGPVVADSTMGWQVLGGAEVTVASLPQVGLSAELGHQWFDAPFTGYDIGGFGLGLSAHWYMR